MYGSIYMTFSKRQNRSDSELVSGHQEFRMGIECLWRDETREYFGVTELYCILTVMVAHKSTHVLKFIEITKKEVNFIIRSF